MKETKKWTKRREKRTHHLQRISLRISARQATT